jgi:hypothetical protein
MPFNIKLDKEDEREAGEKIARGVWRKRFIILLIVLLALINIITILDMLKQGV